jgi:hypothetical protein
VACVLPPVDVVVGVVAAAVGAAVGWRFVVPLADEVVSVPDPVVVGETAAVVTSVPPPE